MSPYVDTPEARLRSALEQTSPAATFVRVEVIDLRAYMDMQDRINQRLDGWVGKTTIRTSLDNAQAMLRGKS